MRTTSPPKLAGIGIAAAPEEDMPEPDEAPPDEAPEIEEGSEIREPGGGPPPTDGRLVVLLFENGDEIAAVAKSTRHYVPGKGWERQVRWVEAMTFLEVNQTPSGWRPWVADTMVYDNEHNRWVVVG
jgi:hypothetical protein